MVTTTAMIIVAICGVCAAVIYSYFIRRVFGGFLRALAAKEASSRESALTLSALGYKGLTARILYASLYKNSTLRRFVGTYYDEETENASASHGGKDIKTQRYYLIPEKSEDAQRRYKNGDSSFLSVIICVVLLAVAAVVFIIAAPYMENFIKGIPGMFNNDTEIKGNVTDGIEEIYPEDLLPKEDEEVQEDEDAESAENQDGTESEDASGENAEAAEDAENAAGEDAAENGGELQEL